MHKQRISPTLPSPPALKKTSSNSGAEQIVIILNKIIKKLPVLFLLYIHSEEQNSIIGMINILIEKMGEVFDLNARQYSGEESQQIMEDFQEQMLRAAEESEEIYGMISNEIAQISNYLCVREEPLLPLGLTLQHLHREFNTILTKKSKSRPQLPEGEGNNKQLISFQKTVYESIKRIKLLYIREAQRVQKQASTAYEQLQANKLQLANMHNRNQQLVEDISELEQQLKFYKQAEKVRITSYQLSNNLYDSPSSKIAIDVSQQTIEELLQHNHKLKQTIDKNMEIVRALSAKCGITLNDICNDAEHSETAATKRMQAAGDPNR